MTRRIRAGNAWAEFYEAQHLPTCPNCSTQMKVDLWPRLPRILPTDGK
jgi:hypothetical protein